MSLSLRAVPGFCFLVLLTASVCGAESLEKRFTEVDTNGDQRISVEEYLKLPGEKAVLQRDFQLFNFNGGMTLTADEFDAIPLGRPAKERGAIPDPFVTILERELARLDQSYRQWSSRPESQVPLHDFVQTYLRGFPDPHRVMYDMDLLYGDADENRDGRVTRDDARRFLEIQLGLRRSDGQLVRLANGQVARNADFVSIDLNRDNIIDLAEFLEHWPHKDRREEQWKRVDLDGDGKFTFDEFNKSQEFGLIDPVEQFRRYDGNLDGSVSKEELLASSGPADLEMAKRAFPGFDLNGDDQLSLSEFRQLPQTNPIIPWTGRFVDYDRDGLLQLLEFQFQKGKPSLLRRVYFERFDINLTGALDMGEFPFLIWPPEALYRINADGTGWKLIFSSDKFPNVGSPKISNDGKWLLCDGEEKAQGYVRKMLLMTIDGKDVRELGVGMMPNFSPDGKQIVFSQSGVQVMDLETKKVRTLVSDGWSAQWSPTSNQIAYTAGPAINTIDVDTGTITEVFSTVQSPYQQILWNISWSGDGKRICFKGVHKSGKPELVSVGIAQPPDLKVHYAGDRFFSNGLAWSPNGDRITVGMATAKSPRIFVHELNPNTNEEPTLLKGPDLSLQSRNSCWSPDGKFLILHARYD